LKEWKRTPAPPALRERVFGSRRVIVPRWWDRIPASATALSGIAAGGLVAWGLIALTSAQWSHPVPAPASKQETAPANVPASVQAVPEELSRVKQIIPQRPRALPRAPVVPIPLAQSPSVPKPFAVPRAAPAKGAAADPLLLEGQTPDVPTGTAALALKTSVTLRIRVGKDGSVLEASIVDGDPALNDVALEAVKSWRYRPYLLNGEPAERTTDVVMNFAPKKVR
jgi:TonB family protein